MTKKTNTNEISNKEIWIIDKLIEKSIRNGKIKDEKELMKVLRQKSLKTPNKNRKTGDERKALSKKR